MEEPEKPTERLSEELLSLYIHMLHFSMALSKSAVIQLTYSQ